MLTLRKIKEKDVNDRDYKDFEVEESDVRDLIIISRDSVRLTMGNLHYKRMGIKRKEIYYNE